MKLICVIDDDEMLSMMLEDHLRSLGDYNVITYSTGEEYLGNAPEGFHLVVLDFNLNSIDPDAANGAQIFAEIQRNNRKIPVIMYSSQEQYEKGYSVDRRRSSRLRN
jgi:CheY-like chemotaxis protein